MSTTPFVEALSDDPYVRELHRRAMRVLNDPTLDRSQRELHVRRIQGALKEHLHQAEVRKRKATKKKGSRRDLEGAGGRACLADPSQVAARRRELAATNPAGEEVTPLPPVSEVTAVLANKAPAANDSQATGRHRPLLTLQRA